MKRRRPLRVAAGVAGASGGGYIAASAQDDVTFWMGLVVAVLNLIAGILSDRRPTSVFPRQPGSPFASGPHGMGRG